MLYLIQNTTNGKWYYSVLAGWITKHHFTASIDGCRVYKKNTANKIVANLKDRFPQYNIRIVPVSEIINQ